MSIEVFGERLVFEAGEVQTPAIVLVALFGLFGWLYTYKRDAWKFWLHLVLMLAALKSPSARKQSPVAAFLVHPPFDRSQICW